MSKRALVSILLLPALVVSLGLATHPDEALNFILGPVDDPSYFCNGPDLSPVTSIAAATVLQNCAAGKTFTLAKGQTIAVDLQSYNGIDTRTQWTDVTVSDARVLSTVSGPYRVKDVAPAPSSGSSCSVRCSTYGPGRLDEVAIYRATRTGRATLSAVQQFCTGNFGGGCGRTYRWNVTVRVS